MKRASLETHAQTSSAATGVRLQKDWPEPQSPSNQFRYRGGARSGPSHARRQRIHRDVLVRAMFKTMMPKSLRLAKASILSACVRCRINDGSVVLRDSSDMTDRTLPQCPSVPTHIGSGLNRF